VEELTFRQVGTKRSTYLERTPAADSNTDHQAAQNSVPQTKATFKLELRNCFQALKEESVDSERSWGGDPWIQKKEELHMLCTIVKTLAVG